MHKEVEENPQPQKKNETMPFAAIWLDLEIIILSEITHREKQIYVITYAEP